MLKQLKTAKKVVGVKQLRRALNNGMAVQVFLALDADPAVTDPIRELCSASEVPFEEIPSMDELGRACGICVGASAAAIVR